MICLGNCNSRPGQNHTMGRFNPKQIQGQIWLMLEIHLIYIDMIIQYLHSK